VNRLLAFVVVLLVSGAALAQDLYTSTDAQRVSAYKGASLAYEKALGKMKEKDLDGALDALVVCFEQMPDYPDGHFLKARILYTEKEYTRALGEIEAARAGWEKVADLRDRMEEGKRKPIEERIQSKDQAILDQRTFEPLEEPGRVGMIGLRPGWPSMIRGYRNNPEGYARKFANGWYLTGDRGTVDADGYYWFVGRDDDVINTGGHLVGPFEVESALLEHPAVAESAAVAKPDPVNMEVVKAFVTLKPGFAASPDLELTIMNFVRKRLSPIAMPQEIAFVDALPRTRSGKIVRRVLRAQEFGEPLGDVSTLMED